MLEDCEIEYLNSRTAKYTFIKKINVFSKNSIYYAISKINQNQNNEDKKEYAIKSYLYETNRDVEKVKNEYKIIQSLKDYDCFIKYDDYFDLICDGMNFRFIVMKYYQNPDLFDLTFGNSKFNGLHPQKACIITYQILQMLKILKDKGIVHHDIKLENFLVVSKSPLKIVLTDFEHANKMNIYKKSIIRNATLYIRAPEILRREMHDFSSDMWSAGIVTFQLLYGHNPFSINDECNTPELLLNCIEKNVLFGNHNDLKEIPIDAKECLINMLKIDPSERITVEEALEMKWFKNITNEFNFLQNLKNQITGMFK